MSISTLKGIKRESLFKTLIWSLFILVIGILLYILNFSLNKCVANIYTLFNYLEKSKIYLGNSDYTKKILTCLFPIVPNLSSSLYQKIFDIKLDLMSWPDVNHKLLEEEEIELPIQIKGKLASTLKTCLLYTSPSPRDRTRSRMPSSA